VVGDNCSTNIKAARLYGVPIIGCASHRLNLDVEKWIESSPRGKTIEKVNVLCRKLRTIKGRAFLKKNNLPNAKIKNDTRWSSVFEMIRRYLDLVQPMSQCSDIPADIVALLLSPGENLQVGEIFKDLENFESVTKFLQLRTATMSEVRTLFDQLIADYPFFESLIGKNASIIKYPDFENALVKLQNGNFCDLTIEEKYNVKWLEVVALETKNEVEDYASCIIKKRKFSETYMDSNWIPPTSVEVERLFSSAKNILAEKRKALKCKNVEMIMCLKANRHLVDDNMINRAFS
jgi:hypothetical protein